MAETTPPSATTKEANPEHSEPENPNPLLNQVEAQAGTIQQPQAPSPTPPQPPTVNPNPNNVPPALASIPTPIPLPVNPYGGPLPPSGSSSAAGPPPHATPSFRPAAPVLTSQFTLIQSNPNPPMFQSQNPGVPPPGVSSAPGMVPSSVQPPQMVQTSMYSVPAGQHLASVVRPPYPNGFMPPIPQGSMPPPGIARYPFTPMIRPRFPPLQPGPLGLVPPLPRPLIPIRPPVIPPVVRPAVTPMATPAEKPETTVYVGKISTTVENDFMRSLLDLCGQVKSWKRAQDPSNGTPRGFGFCEFESAEGTLRALRLLNKLSVDGQELGLNIKQATKEYLERYVQKKKESLSKLKEVGSEEAKTEGERAPDAQNTEDELKNEISKPCAEESKKDEHESGNNDNIFANFGLVSDEDREADRRVLEKLSKSLVERLKTKPLPPPPAQKAVDSATNTNSEVPAKSGDKDMDADNVKKDDDKNDDDTTSETKNAGRAGTESPERGRRYDGRGRERDRERDLKRDKERELERLERERERERDRRERARRVEIQRAERMYKERLLEWEDRERQRESERKHEKEREKERKRERQKLIEFQEYESEDDSRKRRRRSEIEERRKRRRREKEDDLADRLKEEEEIVEAEKKAEEEEKREKESGSSQETPAVPLANGSEKVLSPVAASGENNGSAETYDSDSGLADHIGDGVSQNGTDDESIVPPGSILDVKPCSNAPSKKLGFGLTGSGKRAVVPSVFNEEEDEDAQKDKKMRPLVPIDYSTEELQAVQDTPTNLAAAAEYAKHISNASSKEEKLDGDMERSRRSHDRSSHRERERGDVETRAIKDEQRERSVDHDRDVKSSQNRKLLDAKQLIDMIPKTRDELFSYEINWTIYDKHELHGKIRPWISSKITDFLGEEEASLVDYIVDLTRRHCKASQLLELLQSILDEEAEMFVLKMWRMLIFEIKKVETGLAAARPKA